jgi:hypothetical protein
MTQNDVSAIIELLQFYLTVNDKLAQTFAPDPVKDFMSGYFKGQQYAYEETIRLLTENFIDKKDTHENI